MTEKNEQYEIGHVEDPERKDDIEQIKTGNVVADNDARNYVDPDLVITEEENKAMRRKIHKRVLPLMCLVYIVQALDKGTLGPASIMGWIDDVGAVGQDYALTGTFLWIGIMAGEPIANQLARRLPLAKLLAGCMFVWTALCLGLAFSLSTPPVFAIRVLLGFFESVFGPCLLSITVQWYLKEEQPFASATWQMMLGAASSIMALFGYAFYHVPATSGLRGWQWMMITVALISFTASIITWFFLPDSPTRARFLTEEEKRKFVERVRRNDQGIKQKVFKRAQAIEALKDPFSWMLFMLAVNQTLVVGGINTFNALLINKAFNFSVTDSQLLSIPLGAMVIITYQLMAWAVAKSKQTLLCMIAFVFPNLIGTIVLICVAPGPGNQGGLIFAFYMMQCFQACNPSIFLMLSRNCAGQSKRSITYAMTYIGWAGGNAIAPQIFQSKWAPRYVNSLYIHIALYGCFITTCLICRYTLIQRNKRKDAAQMVDGVVINRNANAFEDMTDIENPDFRYSI